MVINCKLQVLIIMIKCGSDDVNVLDVVVRLTKELFETN